MASLRITIGRDTQITHSQFCYLDVFFWGATNIGFDRKHAKKANQGSYEQVAAPTRDVKLSCEKWNLLCEGEASRQDHIEMAPRNVGSVFASPGSEHSLF